MANSWDKPADTEVIAARKAAEVARQADDRDAFRAALDIEFRYNYGITTNDAGWSDGDIRTMMEDDKGIREIILEHGEDCGLDNRNAINARW
jgi:hypothetical protein